MSGAAAFTPPTGCTRACSGDNTAVGGSADLLRAAEGRTGDANRSAAHHCLCRALRRPAANASPANGLRRRLAEVLATRRTCSASWSGTAIPASQAHRVVVIEAEIDDMNPQIFGVLIDRLLAEGALDVFYTSIQMKKNRPGTLLSIIAPPDGAGAADVDRVSRDDDDRSPLPRDGPRVPRSGDGDGGDPVRAVSASRLRAGTAA